MMAATTDTARIQKIEEDQTKVSASKSPSITTFSRNVFSSEGDDALSSPKSDGFESPPRGRIRFSIAGVEEPSRHAVPKITVKPSSPEHSAVFEKPPAPTQRRSNTLGSLGEPASPHSSRHDNGERRKSVSTFGTRALSPGRPVTEDGNYLNGLGYALMRSLKRPERQNGELPKLKDVASYWIRLMRTRKALGVWMASKKKVSLCDTCRDLGLVDENFVLPEDNNADTSKLPLQMQRGTSREPLGTLKEIADRSWKCSLCRLIVSSIREQGGHFSLLHPDAIYHGFPPSLNEYNSKCFATWHVRDRNRISGGYVSSVRYSKSSKRTRRLKIEWADTRIEPFYIGKVEDPFGEGGGSDPISYLHSKQPTAIAVIRGWLNRCRREHPFPCLVKRDGLTLIRSQQAFFGVIDLQEMRLTRLPPGQRYVALSYTWGQKGDFRCLRSNVRALQQFEGIERIRHELPRVIQDAMELTRGIGERYLWVDSLCIVQDSQASWQLNANIMHEVYRHSTCTICAADGADAMSGLSALSTDKRNEKRHAKRIESYSRGFRLMASYPAEYYIKQSAWNTRAWTFQERLLSRRCIIFAGGKIFFQCGSMTLREEIFAGDINGWPAEVPGTPADLVADISNRPLKVYTECVELYTRRFLTREIDILSAFAGVSHVMNDVLGNRGTLHGLPRSHFDWALLWQCRGRAQYRGEQKADANGRKVVEDMPSTFPTWSWAGWYTPERSHSLRSNRGVTYSPGMLSGVTTNVNDWLRRHTWIDWYVRDRQGDLRRVWTPSEAGRFTLPSQSRWAGYQRREGNPDPYGRMAEATSLGKHKVETPEFDLTLDEFPYSVSVKTEPEVPGLDGGFDGLGSPDLRFLQFFTWSAYFALKQFDRFEEELDGDMMFSETGSTSAVPLRTEPDPRWAIIDRHGELSGVITPDRTSWRAQGVGDGSRSGGGGDGRGNGGDDDDSDSGDSIDLYTGSHRFIALSEAKEFSAAEAAGWAEYMPTEADGTEWNLFYVLLVKEIAGVCHRIGLGKVYKEALDHGFRGPRQWREVILG